MDSLLVEIPVPSMGATVNELTVIDIMIEDGQAVKKGEQIAELESDKSVFEFESPCDGVVRAVLCRAGDIVPSGAPFLRIETSDLSLRHLALSSAGQSGGNGAVRKSSGLASTDGPTPANLPVHPHPSAPSPKAAAPAGIKWTPRAIKLATDAGLDPAGIIDIEGTGPGGRVSGDDLTRYLERQPKAEGTAPVPSAAIAGATGDQTVCVAGIGYAFPRQVRSNQEILKAFPDMTEKDFFKVTGIRQRYVAGPDESATSLAEMAANNALEMAGLKASDLDGVIVATLIPDQPVPSAASALARQLGIRYALAFDVNAACSGWLYGLEVARAFIRAGTAKRLLVATAELLSRITNPRDQSTAFLFGDGAGAAIVTDSPAGHRLNRMGLSGDAELYTAIQRRGGGARQPVPQPGDNLDQFYITMDGAVVFKHAVIAFGTIIEDTLKRHNLTVDEVDWIVPHQANERILKAVSKRVSIPYEKFVVTIGEYGNTSAASVSMAFGWAAEEGIFSSGDKIIFCSVGAGLTFAGGLLVW
ncbi:MAG: beta-ketoacyl-ACP synthase 3 [Opitutaceae bacterium]